MIDFGNLFVIAAPSGTGKTTLVKSLVDSTSKITVSISYTTRPKRPSETDGVNYHFIDKQEFERMVEHGDFLEHATIFDNFYGTSKSWVEQMIAKGIDVILEIDWQGHEQIKQLFPDVISIFILPPSLHDLQDRLVKRNQDHPEIIKKRLADAKEAVAHLPAFDYVVVNDDFTHALHDLKTVIEAGRLLKKHQIIKHEKLIGDFKTANFPT